MCELSRLRKVQAPVLQAAKGRTLSQSGSAPVGQPTLRQQGHVQALMALMQRQRPAKVSGVTSGWLCRAARERTLLLR